MNELNIKGRVGDFQFGYNPNGKCEWYVVNRETGEIVDRAENMSTASSRAAHHNFVAKLTDEQKADIGW